MNDRNWLLNNNRALACTRRCIQIIAKDAGIKISLADKDLLEKIGAVNKSIDSPQLEANYKQLLKHAGVSTFDANETMHQIGEKLHDVGEKLQGASRTLIESIEYHGKEYPRFDDQGREFKGVYRGAVRYA